MSNLFTTEALQVAQGLLEQIKTTKQPRKPRGGNVAKPRHRRGSIHEGDQVEEESGEDEGEDEEGDELRDLIDGNESDADAEDLGGMSDDEADALKDARRRSSRSRRIRSTNNFIDAALRNEPGDDDYADLEDFIVVKQGKKYY